MKAKVETVNENENENDLDGVGRDAVDGEEENLESLLSTFGENDGGDGDFDNFANAEEREARAARERRLKRKRRLESVAATADAIAVEDTATAAATTTAAAAMDTEKTRIKQQQETKDDTEMMTEAGIEIKIQKVKQENDVQALKKWNNGENGSGDDDDNDDDSDSDDDSDMFGSPSSPSEDHPRKKKKKKKDSSNNNNNNNSNRSKNATARQDGFDDSEGYYKTSIGETMELEVIGGNDSSDTTLRLRVLGVIGKGVFSSVLKCSTTTITTTNNDGIPTSISTTNDTSSGNTNKQLPPEVAIKCIRSNETMSKAALNEMKFLIRLRDSPGIVPLLLPSPPTPPGMTATSNSSSKNKNKNHNHNPNYIPPPIDFRGHTLLIFPYLPYNLRDVLQKFGKGVGLSLQAVRNYYGQLLSAATHLQKHRVLHADVKPDNILVSADFSKVLLADFGSAVEAQFDIMNGDDDDENDGKKHATATGGCVGGGTNEMITPYLVSRFHRAPEIILGLQPITYAIDLWSLAVTAGELFLGKVLLRGSNNNDMLFAMMETLVSKIHSFIHLVLN